MKRKTIFCILFFCFLFSVYFYIRPEKAKIGLLDNTFRTFQLDTINEGDSIQISSNSAFDLEDYLLVKLYFGKTWSREEPVDTKHILRLRNQLIIRFSDYLEMKKLLTAILNDMQFFPVAHSTISGAFVSFEDSFGQERLYGGKRFHEGCDVMADKNVSNVYPIVSVCDGIVSKKGWLEKGGYRIGIQSNNGIYYYYAHLSAYANIEEGDFVHAGDLIGYMGNTGYSMIEGTNGPFDVHLHFGIYYDVDGQETSINPYFFLKYILNKVLYFEYLL